LFYIDHTRLPYPWSIPFVGGLDPLGLGSFTICTGCFCIMTLVGFGTPGRGFLCPDESRREGLVGESFCSLLNFPVGLVVTSGDFLTSFTSSNDFFTSSSIQFFARFAYFHLVLLELPAKLAGVVVHPEQV